MKLCTQCRHHQVDRGGDPYRSEHACTKVIASPVDGKLHQIGPNCIEARAGLCGIEGVFWEERVTAPAEPG